MFATYESDKLDPIFAKHGETTWRSVSVFHNSPWFHATCTWVNASNDICTRTFMLAHAEQLIDLANIPEIKIRAVDIVSPSYMNDSNRWKMEPIKEIWLCADKAYPDQFEHQFVLESGQRYSHSAPHICTGEFVEQLMLKVD